MEGQGHFMVASFPEVFKVKGPICLWKVCKGEVNSAGFVRKTIGSMTNDEQLARALADQCDSCGGLDRIGTVFPPRLVASVLKVIKRKVLDQKVISAVELESGGPTAELPDLWNQPYYKEYWDDVNGGFLNPRLVREARLLELDSIKKEKVYGRPFQGRGREEGY